MSNLPDNWNGADAPTITDTHYLRCNGCDKSIYFDGHGDRINTDYPEELLVNNWYMGDEDCPDTENCDGTLCWIEKDHEPQEGS